MTAALLSRRMFLATAVAGTALAEIPCRACPAEDHQDRRDSSGERSRRRGRSAPASQRPFIIDVGAADAITQNVAQSVQEGKQKTQYVYRVFPLTTTFGVLAVQNMVGVFTETKVTPKRVAVIGANTAMVQILQNAPKVVWPKEMTQAPMVFPRPKL